MSNVTRGKKQVYVEVDPDIVETIDAIRAATGLKKYQIIEIMVRNTRLGLDDIPRDWDLTNLRNMNQELPYAETA